MIDRVPESSPRRPPLGYVEFRRPRCPECRSPNLRAYRTRDGGDGTLLRHTTCKDCGRKFILVLT